MSPFPKGYARCSLLAAGIFWLLHPAVGEEAKKAVYSGSLNTIYNYRASGSNSDQDVYGYWYLRGRDLADQYVDIYTSGRLHKDIDGTGSSYAEDPYLDLSDSSQQNDVRLYQCYLDWHDPKKNASLRLGRQYVDVADYIQIDGVQGLLFENKKLGGRVFFGNPASYYSSTSGDLFGGVSVVGRPWEGNQTRGTYARYHDDSVAGDDDHYFLDVRQQFLETLRTRAYVSVMNEDVQMAGGDVFYTALSDKAFDAVLGVQHWGQFDAVTRAYSPLAETLGDLEPYTTAYGRFTQQILSWLYVAPGATFRQTDKDTNATNQDYKRYDLNFIMEANESLTTTLGCEYWDVGDGDRFWSLSGDVRYRYHKLWEVSAGAAYMDYNYSQLSDYSVFTDDTAAPPVITPLDGTRQDQSPNAYTYFLRGKWNITQNLALRLAGEIEDDSDAEDLAYQIRTSLEVRL
ncbi:MAG: hypothetical protein K9M54_05120 [Kiritimatiellales bacterium]|nr:hypothetical protein [Kiritimatiellales bacterium]MCF7863623.1 hypothetical protein [Kiritimatiellales bacterium]